MKTPLVVLSVVRDEAIHLQRFFDRLVGLDVDNIYVIDTGSKDGTLEILNRNGANIIQEKWKGNQAIHINKFLANFKQQAFILRLDADEYCTPELIGEINNILQKDTLNISAFELKRRHVVSGYWIRRGMYPTGIVRLWLNGWAKYPDNSLMDEHLSITGKVISLKHDFIDENLKTNNDWWIKHLSYAKREATMINLKYNLSEKKKTYYRLPLFLRAFIYTGYILLVRAGILNSPKIVYYLIRRSLFYRLLVDYYIVCERIIKII